ncbi:hypothetical protein Tco_1346322 [Tanacetum coccineum]
MIQDLPLTLIPILFPQSVEVLKLKNFKKDATLKLSKSRNQERYEHVGPEVANSQNGKVSRWQRDSYGSGAKEPKKARKFKKPASPKLKTIPVSPKEPTKNPAKKTKAPAKGKRSKTIEILSDVSLSEAALLKEATKRSKKDFHISQGSGSGDGVGSQLKVPDESEDKTTGTDEGTDDDNDDDSDDVSKGDDDKADSDDDEKYESDDDKENMDEEEYVDLYKDVDVKSLRARSMKRKGKTDGSKQTSSVSSDFASASTESSTQAPPLPIVPMTAIPETSTVAATTVPPLIQPFSSILQMTTPTLVPITEPTTSIIPARPDFTSLFGFDQRVTRIGFATKIALESYTAESEKKAQAEKEKYINIIEKSVKEIIKDEVKSQLPQTLPNEISNFASPVIQSSINEELENILLDKLEKSESYRAAEQHRDLYDALVKSYQLDKDLFDSYGKTYSLKRGGEDKDKDEDPPARSDQGLKKKKTSKDAEPPKGSKSKEFKSCSSKGSKSQPKSSGEFAQAEEPVFETADTEMTQDQRDDMGNTEDQPNFEEASKYDWFKKQERPPTPNRN